MTKGFVFTLDAVIAATVAIVLLMVIFNVLFLNTTNFFNNQQLASVGNDLFAIMEQNGTFHEYVSKSENVIEEDLQNQMQILPPNYCGNITIKFYKYQNGFIIDKLANEVKTNCVFSNEKTKVKRVFVDYDKERFGLAEMELWLK